MSALQQARTALAALAPSGVHAYDHLPGSAELPAMVVGLPQAITSQGAPFGFAKVTLPITVVVPGNIGIEAETNLMDQVSVVSIAVRAANLKGFRIDEIRDYGLVDVGGAQGFSASIVVSFYIPTNS